MKHLVYLMVLLVLALSLVGCGIVPQVPVQDVWVLSQPGTINTVLAITEGKVISAQILAKGNDFIAFLWPIKQMGWATVFVNIKNFTVATTPQQLADAIGQANVFNSKVMADFVTFMADQGFEQIDPKNMPPALLTLLRGKDFVAALKASPTMIIVLPNIPAGDSGDWLNLLYPEIQN